VFQYLASDFQAELRPCQAPEDVRFGLYWMG
jgi:hypothetical protein